MSKQKPKEKAGSSTIALNKRARHEYHIDEHYEAGIALEGWEVKSLRAGRANLGDAYAIDQNGELWLYNFNIPEYDSGGYTKHEPKRARKLLLKKREIEKLASTVAALGPYAPHRPARPAAAKKELHDA